MALPTPAMRPAHGRATPICSNGIAVGQEQQEACTRDTDGNIAGPISDWSACFGFADCDGIGIRTRTQPTCENGVAVNQEIQDVCTRDTDGNIAGPLSNWSACGGFDSICDNFIRTRTQPLCENGVAGKRFKMSAPAKPMVQALVRQHGPCGGFDSICDQTGTRTRTDRVCSDGFATDQQTQEACFETQMAPAPASRRRAHAVGLTVTAMRQARTIPAQTVMLSISTRRKHVPVTPMVPSSMTSS